MKKLSFGQTLLEVVFAVGVLALIGTAVVALSTLSVRNNSFAKNKTKANKYTQEAMEWIKQQKEDRWQNIWPHAGNSTEKKYCLSCLEDFDPGCTATWSNSEKSCDLVDPSDNIAGTIYDREIWLLRGGGAGCTNNTCFTATAVLYWTDGQGVHDVQSKSIFTNWGGL